MTYSSIKNIRNNVTKLLSLDRTLQNINLKCIVKKVNSYSYITYVELCDIDDLQSVITGTIHFHHFTDSVMVNDVLVVTGDIVYSKTLTLKIKSYNIDKPQISNYDKIIKQLKDNNHYNCNQVPSIIVNVGIISSLNAAGLKDCLDILYQCNLQNIYIYPTMLQGPTMEKGVIGAINKANLHNKCDILLLVRGGGSRADLEWFDNYNIAKNVIQSKIPIVCGIGHEIDHSVMDVVCVKSFNTPTHVATWIKEQNDKINMLSQYLLQQINECFNTIDNKIIKIDKCINGINEREYNYIKKLYDKKVNDLSVLMFKINKAIIHYDKYYNSLIHNEYNNKLNLHLERIINYIDDKIKVKVYDKTNNKQIITKYDLQNSYNKGNNIILQFVDGDVSLNNYA